ncbi:uracil-DNA glycosylase [Paludisphaera mucosa]|uniref:Type-4 uracil-DNA glycosylase n=1 Tax=Paludisphaera mucosa TaxID=3030827 RepID=A0ABT6FDW0_9BACT|nr:uracil-DNA glycosylase [Paludisphaera mucosa]MDG3005578.1 uracil-DNA glycosylase [Paludisphaera mucosa]
MDEATDFDYDAERLLLIREVRQRLESLSRAGAATIPKSPERPRVPRPAAATVARPRPEVEPEPIPPPVVERPEPPPPVATPIAAATSTPTPAKPKPRAVEPPAPASLFGVVEFKTPALAPEDRAAALAVLAQEVAGCVKCAELAATRTQTVFADGSPTARLMFIGEAPGAEEDRRGVPFVGKAGQLLTDMITKGMGLRREDVYIANILKCRPPENRDPAPHEASNCFPYLERQIEIVRPEYLCLLGRISTSTLLNTALSMSRLRGRWHRVFGVPTIATYHPAYLLRNPAAKKDAWEDLQMLMRAMGLVVPKKKG